MEIRNKKYVTLLQESEISAGCLQEFNTSYKLL